MSPLSDEALREGGFDVVVQREGEDIIGPLCDGLLSHTGDALLAALGKIPGISFFRDGQLVQTPRTGLLRPEFVELPDFDAIRDLTPRNPLAAGVIETTRGCVEHCSYCQVIQQFLGYRMVPRETERRRLLQLHDLASRGLIYSNGQGRFSVFVSDDLHTPPLRATKFRNERLGRLKDWSHWTKDMWLVAQVRAEVAQDAELATALGEAGFRMLYVGVESRNAQNLQAVHKRQQPDQVDRDLRALGSRGFILTAMTILGLPFDTTDEIMEMAEWVRSVSKYQTANLLTPLPATSNWHALTPLDEDGSVLPPGKMRPYHLYTGRQLVHRDARWTMQESRVLFDQYTQRIRPVDTLYERIFKMFKWHGRRITRNVKDGSAGPGSHLRSTRPKPDMGASLA